MTRKMTIALALIGVFGLAACSDTPDTLADVPTTLPESENVQALLADIQAEMDDIAAEIENSGAGEDLQAAWNKIEAEAQSVMTSVTQDDAIDTTGLEQQLDEFQNTVTAMSDEVSDELVSSWNELRQAFDRLIG